MKMVTFLAVPFWSIRTYRISLRKGTVKTTGLEPRGLDNGRQQRQPQTNIREIEEAKIAGAA
jgi:hypothetical protein